MPFTIIQRDGQYCVAKKDGGEVLKGACHPTKEKAVAQLAAIASEERRRGKAEYGADESEWVYRPAFLFEAGDYPDRAFSLTPEELASAVDAFSPCPLDLGHRNTVLDGKLGSLEAVHSLDGQELCGAVRIPVWLNDVMGDEPLPVSCEWDRATKRLTKLALVTEPRVPQAALMSAYAAFAGRRHSAADADDMQQIHDIATRQGAECAAKMSAHPGTTPASEGGMRRRTMSLKSRWLEFWGGVPEEEFGPSPAAAEQPGKAEMSATPPPPPPDPRVAELEKALATERAHRIATQAAAFADGEIAAGRAYPAERMAMVASFAQAAQDDEATAAVVTFGEGQQGSRMDALKAMFAARPKHGLTEEQMPAALQGATVLMNRETPAGKDGPMSAERKAELLGMTPLGKAVLDAKK